MTGEELNRKYLQLIGWHVTQQEEGFRLNLHGGSFHPCRATEESAWGFDAPRLCSNANMMIDELNRVFRADGWLLEMHQGETKLCATEEPVVIRGVTPERFCEAGLKAMIAAKEFR